MKSKRHLHLLRPSALAAATLALAASSAFSQTLLLSDNFDTAALGPAAFNDSAALTADQSGTAATKDYNVSVGGGWDGAFQRGNGGTMLMYAGAGNFGSTNMAASLNYDIAAAANILNSPLEIKFNMSVSAPINDLSEWTSFTVGGGQNPFVNDDSVGFSSLFRDNGGTQQFTNGADLGDVPYSNPGPSFTDNDLITFVLSDTAGTGSAFNSDGATDVVKMYVNGSLTNTFTGLDLDATDQYISFNAQNTVANIDNLTITATAPPPPTNSGTWTNPAGGLWNTEANWLGNVVATGSGSTANFNTLDITADTTVNLDSVRAIGNLDFGDTNTTSAAGWTLSDNGTPGNVLILAGTTPTITVNALGDTKTATISAAITGSSGLTKSGPGTLTLTAANSYTGATTVSEGTLLVSGQSYFNVGRTTTVASGAVLELNDSNNAFATLMPTSTVTGDGTFRLSGNSIITQYENGAGGNRLTFAMTGGLIDLQGTTNLYNGGWQELNWTDNKASMNIASGAALNLADGQDIFVDALTGAGNVVGGLPARALIVGVNGGSGTFSGSIDIGASLIKQGSGTQTLSGTLNCSGNTTVEDGTLSIGSGGSPTNLSDSATVSIAFGATMNLNFTGNDTVGALDIDGSGPLPADTYNTSHPTYGDYFTGSGSLVVPETATPYEIWANSFDPAIGLPAEDDDNDGVTNFEEYAFGLLPNSGASVNPIAVQLDKSTGTFSYTRRIDSGLTYSVWYSTDLNGWFEDTSATEDSPVESGDNETVEVTLSTLPGDPLPSKLFIQVRAD
jgi:autotransporter-associated beta strand protein